MATTKSPPPPKSVGEVLPLLKLTKDKNTTAFASKMGKLLEFLHLTSDMRTSAEVVEKGVSITEGGMTLPPLLLRRDFIDRKLSKMEFLRDEERSLERKSSEINRNIFETNKILTSKAKVNTPEKKEKARLKIEELEAASEKVSKEMVSLRQKIVCLRSEAKNNLEAIENTPEEMRKYLGLLEGEKIRVTLETGQYTFPVPVNTPFQRIVYNLVGLSMADEVKEKPVIKRSFTLPAEALEVLRKAIPFASTDDLRPAMTGVLVEIKKAKMQVIATDAHRLYLSRKMAVDGPKGDFTFLLPREAVSKLPKSTTDDFGLYEMKDGTVSILQRTITPIDARFPDYRVVIPTYDTGVTFNREDFTNCVRQVLPFANKCTDMVAINFNGDLKFAAQDIDFSFESGVQTKYISKDMPDATIAFNGKFLVEAMKTFKSDKVTLKSEGSPSKAGIFTDGVDDILIMPLMQ